MTALWHISDTSDQDVCGKLKQGVPQASWGSITLIDALRSLLAAALEEPSNQKMMLISESGIPLFAPQLVYSQLIQEEASRLNSCSIEVWKDTE